MAWPTLNLLVVSMSVMRRLMTSLPSDGMDARTKRGDGDAAKISAVV